MGYDLHITRRKDWCDEGDDIALEEFVRYVKNDPEFRYPGQDGDKYADWRSRKTGYESWLGWGQGQIDTKNPEPEFINKMVSVARELGARVQGDDGEIYLSATEIKQEESPARVAAQTNKGFSGWPLWKQLVAAFLLGCVLLGIKLLFFGL